MGGKSLPILHNSLTLPFFEVALSLAFIVRDSSLLADVYRALKSTSGVRASMDRQEAP